MMQKIMEDPSVHDSKFNFFKDEPKVVEKTKGKTKIPGRRTLANISNMPQGVAASNQYHKSGPSLDALKKHVEQLQKEKAALMKRLAEKNKVIELSGTEMRKLRVTLEKVKQQNLQLAQSNSQMLEELRSVKERQKTLDHELGCKNGLIISKNLELEHNKVTEPEETEVCTVAETDDNKHDTSSSSQISKIPDNNDKGKSKRLQKRRQSAKFEPKPTQDSPNINNLDDDDGKMEVNDSNAGCSSLSSKMEAKEGDSFQDYNKPCEDSKTSLSRPVREAAKKVQSYKEINLNVKMRRE